MAAAIQIACAALESSANQITCAALIPEQRQQLHSATIQKCDLSKDPRVTSPQMPLIIFSAQLQRFYPDSDFDEMIAAAAGPKLLHDLDVPCELLLWSEHQSLVMFDDEMAAALKRFTEKKAMKYDLVHYFRIGLPGRAIAFAPNRTDNTTAHSRWSKLPQARARDG